MHHIRLHSPVASVLEDLKKSISVDQKSEPGG